MVVMGVMAVVGVGVTTVAGVTAGLLLVLGWGWAKNSAVELVA